MITLNPLHQDSLQSCSQNKGSLQELLIDFDLRQYSFEDLVDELVLSDSQLEICAMGLGDHLMSPSLRNMENLDFPSALSSDDQYRLNLLLNKYFNELSKKPGYEFITQCTFPLRELDFRFIAKFVRAWNQYFHYQEDNPRFLQLFFSFCDADRVKEISLFLSEVCKDEKEALWPVEIIRPESSFSSDSDPIYIEMILKVFNFILSSPSIPLPPVIFLEHLFNESSLDFSVLISMLEGDIYSELKDILDQTDKKLQNRQGQVYKTCCASFFREAIKHGYVIGLGLNPNQIGAE